MRNHKHPSRCRKSIRSGYLKIFTGNSAQIWIIFHSLFIHWGMNKVFFYCIVMYCIVLYCIVLYCILFYSLDTYAIHLCQGLCQNNWSNFSKFQSTKRYQKELPTSPSIFAIFIEPLAAAFRQNKNIKAIQYIQVEHKRSLYAEDVILFLQNWQTSLSQTITLIK